MYIISLLCTIDMQDMTSKFFYLGKLLPLYKFRHERFYLFQVTTETLSVALSQGRNYTSKLNVSV